jgi:hypothetical protein
MRPLTLHASALSNDEYELYTASFQELVDEGATHRSDAYYEETTIGVREARAWLRGRYSELNAADLDLVRVYTRIEMRVLGLSHVADTKAVLPGFGEDGRFERRAVFRCPPASHTCSWRSECRSKPHFRARYAPRFLQEMT